MRYSKNKSKNSTKGEDENASASFQMELGNYLYQFIIISIYHIEE